MRLASASLAQALSTSPPKHFCWPWPLFEAGLIFDFEDLVGVEVANFGGVHRNFGTMQTSSAKNIIFS